MAKPMAVKKRLLAGVTLAALGAAGWAEAQTPPGTPMPGSQAPAAASGAPIQLTLKDAEALALKNHPQVLAAQNEVLAADEQIVETKSAYYPVLDADLTGSQANQNARMGAGYLTDSRLFSRFGQGITFSQLVTDSGRTPNLVASSKFSAQASQQSYMANRYDVVLAVNRAYFEVLRAQALVRVAEQTVAARQVLLDQVTALFNNKLRSEVDVSFADVNLSDAKLLLIRAQNQLQASEAELNRTLGTDKSATYKLTDEPMPPTPPVASDDLIAQAMANRPELAGARLTSQAAQKFEIAERDLARPTVSIVGVAGFLPLFASPGPGFRQPSDYYEGAALNVDIPIFNGHLFSARRQAAHYQALAADQRVRNEQERITRDVQVAWTNSVTAFQRIDVTEHLVKEAALSQDLAQGRYNLGLASIVELTQAELNLTSAQIENLNAKYDYHSQYAVLQYTQGLLR